MGGLSDLYERDHFWARINIIILKKHFHRKENKLAILNQSTDTLYVFRKNNNHNIDSIEKRRFFSQKFGENYPNSHQNTEPRPLGLIC
jgi:hypothetical protein